MMQFAQWEEQNNRYLSVALRWIRSRLEAVAQQDSESACLQTEGLDKRKRTRQKKVKERLTAEEEAYVQALKEAESMGTPPALLVLRDRFNLSVFEMHILLLCIAMELDTRTANLCALAQGHPRYNYPTFALAMKLFEMPAWEVLSPERPLRYWRLLEVMNGGQSLVMSPLKADECIVHFVKGLNYMDERLAPFVIPMNSEEERGDGHQNQDREPMPSLSEEIATDLLLEWKSGSRPIINLLGPDPETKQEIARGAAHSIGYRLYRLPIEWLPAQIAEVEVVARLWQARNCFVKCGVVY